jgi:hypothetical protein
MGSRAGRPAQVPGLALRGTISSTSPRTPRPLSESRERRARTPAPTLLFIALGGEITRPNPRPPLPLMLVARQGTPEACTSLPRTPQPGHLPKLDAKPTQDGHSPEGSSYPHARIRHATRARAPRTDGRVDRRQRQNRGAPLLRRRRSSSPAAIPSGCKARPTSWVRGARRRSTPPTSMRSRPSSRVSTHHPRVGHCQPAALPRACGGDGFRRGPPRSV